MGEDERDRSTGRRSRSDVERQVAYTSSTITFQAPTKSVKALLTVPGLPQAHLLDEMNPEGLDVSDGVVLIEYLTEKAAQLNQIFHASQSTPRRVDMVLWTYGR